MGLLPILEQNGMEVSVSGNFRDAQEKLLRQNCDLVFADAELPGGSWQRLLETAVKSGKNCEVIVCSRCGDEQLWAEVLQCGAYDMISEPFEGTEIARIARYALDSHYLRRYGAAAGYSGLEAKAS
jgi:two-component system repressor protein LuxO